MTPEGLFHGEWFDEEPPEDYRIKDPHAFWLSRGYRPVYGPKRQAA